VPTFVKIPPLSRDIAPYEPCVNEKEQTDGWHIRKTHCFRRGFFDDRDKKTITTVGIVIVVIGVVIILTIRLKHL